MAPKPPKPFCKALLVCAQIVQDARTGQTILFDLLRSVRMTKFPAKVALPIFFRWTSGHGKYEVEFSLEDMDGVVVSRFTIPGAYDMPDPLEAYELIAHDVPFTFPRPGRYDLVVNANGEEVVRDAIYAIEIPGAEAKTE